MDTLSFSNLLINYNFETEKISPSYDFASPNNLQETLNTCIREVFGSNLGPESAIPSDIFVALNPSKQMPG
jgi:hypothetical protein